MSIQLSELLENLYGVRSTHHINKLTNMVQDTVTKVMSGNPNRLSFVFTNNSANNIYLSTQNDVASTKGIFVASNGGTVVIQWDRDFELVSSEWFAIASAINSNVFILENISI